MSKPLFEEDDDSNDETEFKLTTNKEYAKVYNELRKKELVKKLKDRGYNNVSSGDDSDDSESSEDDEEVNVEFDREFFKTLASLKSKDPAIYDKNTRFFDIPSDDDAQKGSGDGKEKTQKSQKAVTLKDFERKVILEHEGKFEDSDEEQQNERFERAASPTIAEEERRLKDEFRKALDAQDSEEEEFGGIFKKRVKSKEDKKQEEEDFAEWLAGKKADIETQAKQKLEPLKEYWNRRNLPQSERFLRDYILNKGYSNTKSSEIPTYEEIVGDDPLPLSDDEKELEKQAEFEEKYNFRFEEPDSEFVKRYPRTIENSVRPDAGKRKEKRIELKKRKQEEKEQKMKELEMLKEIKRKEIAEKIEKLKKVTGNEEVGFNDAELEEDFDPEAHDRRMKELFNEDYYQVDEGEEKPECPSDIDELKVEDWDNYDPKQAIDGNDDYEAHCEDDDFNMDCEYDPEAAKRQHQEELIENTKRRKNRRGRRNRFMEMIQQEKPPFNPEDEKTYAEYIEEYYKLDCEDIIGDLPCRFKYVETTPNDFGLTVEEILLAKNKELNQWASLKKTLQIRPEQVEKRDQRLYKLKAKNDALKRKIFKSLYGENSDDENDDNDDNEEGNAESTTAIADGKPQKHSEETVNQDKKKPGKKRKHKKPAESIGASSTAELEVKKPKTDNPFAPKADKQSISVEGKVDTAESGASDVTMKKKKKKKKKKSQVFTISEQQSPTQQKGNPPESSKKEVTEKPNLQKTKKANPFAGNAKRKPFKFENKKPILSSKSKTKFKPGKNKSRNNAAPSNASHSQISDDRLKAYSINPRKFHKKQKFAAKKPATN